MVARWSANPLGMLWPGMDPAFEAAGGGNGGPTARRPPVIASEMSSAGTPPELLADVA